CCDRLCQNISNKKGTRISSGIIRPNVLDGGAAESPAGAGAACPLLSTRGASGTAWKAKTAKIKRPPRGGPIPGLAVPRKSSPSRAPILALYTAGSWLHAKVATREGGYTRS